ncbi:MAG: hypothetical protein JWM11_1672 [Planctomycetaceae bacterium]|nr:hypothetical protein [Planctomycetaceae bacterium]
MRHSQLWIGIAIVCLAAVPIIAGDKISVEKGIADSQQPLLWYDIRLLGLEGQGWTDLKAPFDRLPAKADGKAPASVWGLSRQSAGLAVRFVTDAQAIHARWTLINANLAMPHMAATGVSGLDLYVRDASGQWRWLAVGQPKAQTNSVAIVSGLPPGEREYLLYLPLYNGVSSVEIGIDKSKSLALADPRPETRRKPVLFYGTSITQGGCASRPGMVYTAILGRKLNRPVINLGFSGSGRMEPIMAELLAEVDPSLYVLDCLPNMSAIEVTERVVPFVKTLRAAHPETPILLVEDRSYTNSFLVSSSRERNTTSRAALKQAYEKLLAEGVKNLGYLTGEQLLGDDGEGTVDSSHPTDLGFLRQAEAFQPAIEKLLGK